jgi:hypothetical protein
MIFKTFIQQNQSRASSYLRLHQWNLAFPSLPLGRTNSQTLILRGRKFIIGIKQKTRRSLGYSTFIRYAERNSGLSIDWFLYNLPKL